MTTSSLLLITVETRYWQQETGKATRITVPAIEVAEERLHASHWPIYAGTKNQSLMIPGTEVFVYIGGTRRLARHIIAVARISGVVFAAPVDIDPRNAVHQAKMWLRLDSIEFLRTPVNLGAVREKLEFSKNGGRAWGSKLQGGCVALSSADAKKLKALGA